MRATTWFAAIASLLICSDAMAIEEPKYTVVEEHDDYEIRRYDAYVVAEVTFYGPYENSGDAAFRVLADYIFGNNSSSTKMEMTAPVETGPTEAGTRMEMTAPVLTTAVDDSANHYRFAFVIESKYTLETVPKPLNDRIRLREVAPRTVAAHRFSGSWRESNFNAHQDKLLEALERDDITTVGRPYYARYNAPFVPWFLRRNEVIIQIAP